MDPFPKTRWSLVLEAGDGGAQALQTLCASYWTPLYAFARRKGRDEQDAQDLVQGFLGRFVERNDFARVHPERGRFRAYLLAAFKNHMRVERERASAQKRGGGAMMLPWDEAEASYRHDVDASLTGEDVFLRQWALSVVAQAQASVQERYRQSGQLDFYDQVKGVLDGSDVPPYAAVATALGMQEGAVKVGVHRLKRRFREALRAEVAQTVETPGEIDAELRDLLAALS